MGENHLFIHRRAQSACALEDAGAQRLTGIADPAEGCRVLSPTDAAGVPCLVGRDEAMGWLVRRWKANQAWLGQGVWACGKRHGSGVAAGRWRWKAPGDALPSKRFVAFLSVRSRP
ncbi:MAG: hypothetical protein ACRERE_16155 [Candidatus Entotheonellia bacterium]